MSKAWRKNNVERKGSSHRWSGVWLKGKLLEFVSGGHPRTWIRIQFVISRNIYWNFQGPTKTLPWAHAAPLPEDGFRRTRTRSHWSSRLWKTGLFRMSLTCKGNDHKLKLSLVAIVHKTVCRPTRRVYIRIFAWTVSLYDESHPQARVPHVLKVTSLWVLGNSQLQSLLPCRLHL